LEIENRNSLWLVQKRARCHSLKNIENVTYLVVVPGEREILSVIPAFELGLWNGWILAIPMLTIVFSDMRATATRESGNAENFQPTRTENIISFATLLSMFFSFGIPFFLPLRVGTIWLYGGLVVYIVGIVFAGVAVQNFASSPKDQLITKGLYGVSRNPMYVGLVAMQIGIVVACSSWLYLLLTVALLILLNANIVAEERYCLYTYGEDYQKYKNNTPRWIGLPKSKE